MDIATIAFWSVCIWIVFIAGIVAVFHRLVQRRKQIEQSWEIRAPRRHSYKRKINTERAS